MFLKFHCLTESLCQSVHTPDCWTLLALVRQAFFILSFDWLRFLFVTKPIWAARRFFWHSLLLIAATSQTKNRDEMVYQSFSKVPKRRLGLAHTHTNTHPPTHKNTLFFEQSDSHTLCVQENFRTSFCSIPENQDNASTFCKREKKKKVVRFSIRNKNAKV